jgi:molecular chaperone DnaK
MNLALLIGCAEYDDPEIQDLRYSDQDARSVAAVLAGTCGVTASDLVVLSSTETGVERSTRNNIFRRLSQPARLARLPEVDLLFFFFSGHGCRSQATGQDYLLPSDTVFESFEETAVPFDTVVRYLQLWRPRQIVMFIDACRSNLRAGKNIALVAEEPIRTEELHFPGLAAFWACSPGQRSYELESAGKGVFSHALTLALGDEGKCKSIAELDAFLTQKVPSLCAANGLREQLPYLRVEPAPNQKKILVSTAVLQRWETAMPVGTEQRSRVSAAPTSLRYNGSVYCGFDFGTSYSAVAICDEAGNPVFVPSPHKRVLVPSVVAFLPNLDYVVGWPAVEYARTNRDAAVFHIKRHLGTAESVSVRGKQFTPEFIASLIIRSLAKNVEEYLGSGIYRAIVSAPANFSMRQCTALERAFELAAVPVIRFVSEPSAAGLAADYNSANEDELAHYVIVDLGGGTLDVAVVLLGDGLWEVRALTGERDLGGLDYDIALQRYVESRIREKVRDAQYDFNEADMSQIRSECERAKIELGTAEEARVVVQGLEHSGGLNDISVVVSRRLFRALTTELTESIAASVNMAIGDADLLGKRVARVFLAGQGAKIFCVRELLESRFPGVPIEDAYQENAVAFGMGRYSGVLRGIVKNRLLLEALPFALGVRIARQIRPSEQESRAFDAISADRSKNVLTAMIVNSHTTIPTRKSDYFRLDGAPGSIVPFDIIERDVTGKRLSPVGTIEVPIGSGTPECECSVDVDANRTITLTIRNFSTGADAYYQINNFFTKPITTTKADYVRLH